GERQALKSELRSHRRKAAEFRSRVDELKVERNALLVQGGAASREQFEIRARLADRRIYLEDQAADAQRDLRAICDEHRELALVEEDLEAYSASENADCIEMLRLEAAD